MTKTRKSRSGERDRPGTYDLTVHDDEPVVLVDEQQDLSKRQVSRDDDTDHLAKNALNVIDVARGICLCGGTRKVGALIGDVGKCSRVSASLCAIDGLNGRQQPRHFASATRSQQVSLLIPGQAAQDTGMMLPTPFRDDCGHHSGMMLPTIPE
jgi:hypothetical protein